MRLSDRQRTAIIGFAILCVAGAILFFPTIYVVGLCLSPPRPVPSTAAQVATGAWITRHWSKKELVESLAARADCGFGWRGAETASRGYFGKPLKEVALPQAALLAAYVGSVGSGDLGMASNWWDPWCGPVSTATKLRRPVLEKMRKNLVIDDAAFETADRSELGLVPDPPPGHKPCPE